MSVPNSNKKIGYNNYREREERGCPSRHYMNLKKETHGTAEKKDVRTKFTLKFKEETLDITLHSLWRLLLLLLLL
jgi:hypothetical protein